MKRTSHLSASRCVASTTSGVTVPGEPKGNENAILYEIQHEGPACDLSFKDAWEDKNAEANPFLDVIVLLAVPIRRRSPLRVQERSYEEKEILIRRDKGFRVAHNAEFFAY
jgi:hypothetical protein